MYLSQTYDLVGSPDLKKVESVTPDVDISQIYCLHVTGKLVQFREHL